MFALFLVFHDPTHRVTTQNDAVFIYQDFSLAVAHEIRKADSTSGKVDQACPSVHSSACHAKNTANDIL